MPAKLIIEPTTLLKEKGLNVTSQRVAIYKTITDYPHATAEEILEKTRAFVANISRQAVFDTLNVFTEKGIIRRIQPANSPARYETRVDDNHHHVVCRSCGITQDVDCALGARPCLEANNDHGFNIDEAEVIYWGTCPTCQRSKRLKQNQKEHENV